MYPRNFVCDLNPNSHAFFCYKIKLQYLRLIVRTYFDFSPNYGESWFWWFFTKLSVDRLSLEKLDMLTFEITFSLRDKYIELTKIFRIFSPHLRICRFRFHQEADHDNAKTRHRMNDWCIIFRCILRRSGRRCVYVKYLISLAFVYRDECAPLQSLDKN